MQPPWDGAFLGVHGPGVVARRWALAIIEKQDKVKIRRRWWMISLDSLEFTCTIRAVRNNHEASFCCLVDAIKPLFGLANIGTHSIVIAGKRYVLYRRHIHAEYFSLLPAHHQQRLAGEVRNIFAFRQLLHIKNTNEQNIALIENNRLLSLGEFSTNRYEKVVPDTVISTKNIDKWFGEESIPEVLRRIFRYNGGNVDELIMDLRAGLENCVRRIDTEHITLIDEISSEVLHRLLERTPASSPSYQQSFERLLTQK